MDCQNFNPDTKDKGFVYDNHFISANWQYLLFPNTPQSLQIWVTCSIFFFTRGIHVSVPIFLYHKSLVLSFQDHEKSPLPLTNYPEHWDVKTFVVAIPIVYPQVEPILAELTQQGFDCFVCKSMENPLWPMRMFSVVFLRRGVKYPTLDCTPFQGTASFRPLKYTAVAVHRSTWVSIVGLFFPACCWYCVRFSVSRDADFMRWGVFFYPCPVVIYTYFPGMVLGGFRINYKGIFS